MRERIRASPLTSRLAVLLLPNRVHFRCRLSGSFHCSPPRLAATQLLQVLTRNTVPDGRGLPPRRIVTFHSALVLTLRVRNPRHRHAQEQRGRALPVSKSPGFPVCTTPNASTPPAPKPAPNKPTPRSAPCVENPCTAAPPAKPTANSGAAPPTPTAKAPGKWSPEPCPALQTSSQQPVRPSPTGPTPQPLPSQLKNPPNPTAPRPVRKVRPVRPSKSCQSERGPASAAS